MHTQKIIQHIVNWLRDYAAQARAQGFVVGVSGGIDSAVVSTLCAQTALPTLLLNMPIRQKIDQFDRAAEHIAALVLDNFPAVWAKVRLVKPGILPDVRETGVEIEREKAV